MIGEGIYFVVYFNIHSQISTLVITIKMGVSITPAMKVTVRVFVYPKHFVFDIKRGNRQSPFGVRHVTCITKKAWFSE